MTNNNNFGGDQIMVKIPEFEPGELEAALNEARDQTGFFVKNYPSTEIPTVNKKISKEDAVNQAIEEFENSLEIKSTFKTKVWLVP